MRMTFALCLFVSPVLQPVALHCFSTHTWSITRLIHQSSTRHQPAGQCSSVNCPHVNSVWLRPHSCVLLFPSHVRSCPRCWTTVFSSSLSHYCRTISLKVSLNSKSLILMVPHILSLPPSTSCHQISRTTSDQLTINRWFQTTTSLLKICVVQRSVLSAQLIIYVSLLNRGISPHIDYVISQYVAQLKDQIALNITSTGVGQ